MLREIVSPEMVEIKNVFLMMRLSEFKGSRFKRLVVDDVSRVTAGSQP